MTLSIVTRDAEVVILTDSAVEASFHMVFAQIARVDEAVLTLVVQLHQHARGAPHGPPQ